MTDERKYLRELTAAVERHLSALDSEMTKPADYQRGQRIAVLMNHLELANDQALRFGLGVRLPQAKS